MPNRKTAYFIFFVIYTPISFRDQKMDNLKAKAFNLGATEFGPSRVKDKK